MPPEEVEEMLEEVEAQLRLKEQERLALESVQNNLEAKLQESEMEMSQLREVRHRLEENLRLEESCSGAAKTPAGEQTTPRRRAASSTDFRQLDSLLENWSDARQNLVVNGALDSVNAALGIG